MTIDRRTRIDVLQAGRALAASAVVVAHAASSTADFGQALPAQLDTIARLGWLGVDFFFVLSGFIIYFTAVPKGMGGGAAEHYARSRLTRIYVPYLPIALALMALYLLIPGLSAGARDWSIWATLTLLPSSHPPALSVAWTLQHEIVFYAMFGIAFFSGHLRAAMLAWTMAITASAITGIGQAAPLKYLLSPINLEFMFGMLVAVAVRRGIVVPTWAWGSAAIFGFAIWAGGFDMSKSASVFAGLGIAALLIPLIAAEATGRLRVPGWSVFLGAASYALYLVHNPILSVVVRVCKRIDLRDPFLVTAAGLAASFLGGIGYFLLVERPLGRRITAFGRRHQSTGAMPAGRGRGDTGA